MERTEKGQVTKLLSSFVLKERDKIVAAHGLKFYLRNPFELSPEEFFRFKYAFQRSTKEVRMFEIKHLLSRCGPLDSVNIDYNGRTYPLARAAEVQNSILDDILEENVPETIEFRGSAGRVELLLHDALSILSEARMALEGSGLHFAFKDNIPSLIDPDSPFVLPDFLTEEEPDLPPERLTVFGYVYNGSGSLSPSILYTVAKRKGKTIFVARSSALKESLILVGKPGTKFFREEITSFVPISLIGFLDVALVGKILAHPSRVSETHITGFNLLGDPRKSVLIWLCLKGREKYWMDHFRKNKATLETNPKEILNKLLYGLS